VVGHAVHYCARVAMRTQPVEQQLGVHEDVTSGGNGALSTTANGHVKVELLDTGATPELQVITLFDAHMQI
jgi:hypothetical protein